MRDRNQPEAEVAGANASASKRPIGTELLRLFSRCAYDRTHSSGSLVNTAKLMPHRLVTGQVVLLFFSGKEPSE